MGRGAVGPHQSAHAARVAVVVNLLEPDTWDASEEFMNGFREWQLEGLRPGTPVISIHASSSVELREKFRWAVPRGDTVEALVVDSHAGSERLGPGHFTSQVAYGPGFREGFDLLKEDQVQEAFRPIVGRFAPGASVIFSGCRLAVPGDREEIRHRVSPERPEGAVESARFVAAMEGYPLPAVSLRSSPGGDPAAAEWALSHPGVAHGAI